MTALRETLYFVQNLIKQATERGGHVRNVVQNGNFNMRWDVDEEVYVAFLSMSELLSPLDKIACIHFSLCTTIIED